MFSLFAHDAGQAALSHRWADAERFPGASPPWLDEERVTGYASIFVLLYAAISVLWIALSPQLIDPYGKPIRTIS